ncbi:MAG: signal peptide-containing protein [Planctomycetes bacterium B3_Pla]|nr:MAG: signal peptide-containing protein [Planctomycetes bacterium B3_Pla]
MVTKWLKRSVIVVAGLSVAGSLLFGKDVVSYVRSSAKSVRTVVKDSVPIEFELRRARDLVEDIIPEMHANVRLIAQEEVEVAALNVDIAKSGKSIDEEKARIAKLRTALAEPRARYCFGGQEYPHSYVKEDLAHRFERFKESELVLAGKRRLLMSREKSLQAAMQLLERTRGRKRMLEDKIESLASQHRLVRAAAVGSRINVDNSKLAQTEKLIAQIKKRLDVAERVLAHESQFVQAIPVDAVAEEDLLAQVDEYFENRQRRTELASAAPKAQQPEQLLEN